ncbi:hypothetical protein JOD55_000634 [Arcanobacterium pluranimalium]|uniref:DUF4126 domain-containing protein n=1 Tax=Arcanobacterium pluranimalium TaxID=108028 RepID=UPI00195E2956|nr:DUF4126 domain-containing protein [Arcanobacterium pluranimalium]MBM7824807.1 hypothetical protein [Arcanobacterium pluranimalium]
MLAVLTSVGLSAAAGLNAYIPFLIVALISRYTEVFTLPSQFSWIESPWAIGIGVLLLLFETVLDKIPAVDFINDVAGSAIRPATGGLIFAATAAAQQVEENSSLLANNPWISVVLGGLTAAIVHAGKMLSRPIINVSTLGIGAPVVSTVEDGTSFTMSLIAIFLPVLVLVILAVLLFALWKILRFVARRRRSGAARSHTSDPNTSDPYTSDPYTSDPRVIDGEAVIHDDAAGHGEILEGEIED